MVNVSLRDDGRFVWRGVFSELSDALVSYDTWLRLALYTIKRRYYTTGLGPFWVLLTNSFFIVGICFLYSGAFNLRFQEYLVHLGLGYIIWGLISDTFGPGANVYLAEYGIYSQLNVNKLGLILKALFCRYIIFFYNLPLILGIVFLAKPNSIIALSSILGLFVLGVNSYFFSYFLSVLSARFRDVPHIIMTIIRFAFFFTPILWEAEAVGAGARGLIVKLNPLNHFIEIVRAPVKSGVVPVESWVFVGISTGVVLLLFLLTYRLAHRNIVLFAA